MRILACDPGTTTGWCFGDTDEYPKVEAGAASLIDAQGDVLNQLPINSACWFYAAILKYKPDLVAMEQWIIPMSGGTQYSVTVRGASTFQVFKAIAGLHSIRTVNVSSATWRKEFCGRGRAKRPHAGKLSSIEKAAIKKENKAMVLRRAKELRLLPPDWQQTDASDAVGIWWFAASEFTNVDLLSR